jgi:DNA-binding SARP family transcriptional activator
MQPPFALQCLGLPKLADAGGHEVRIRVRKHLAILVYLAVEGRSVHRRDRLVELLWPRAPVKQARQSFATALSVLRSRLGADGIESTHDHLRLRPGWLSLDIDRLESGNILGDDLTLPLEVDGFLNGFEVDDAPEFGIWQDSQQARLLPLIQTGLHTLIDFARRTANVTELSRHADRLLSLNDLSEEAVRARMEALALTGDRITALRIFEEWSDRLHAELGAKPSRLIDGMAIRLRRRGWERPAESPVPTVRTEQWRDRLFVGRSREYRTLYEAWEQVSRAEPRHTIIFGDSGVGKTTLADRLGTAIALEGATLARVRCFELERGIPYATVGSAIETLLDRPGAAATTPTSLAEIGRIVPAVRRKYPDLPAPEEVQGESARIRFAEATLELLLCLMEEHPVVLVVDDFHLADEASLAVLHLIMRRVEDRPFMVLLTSRSELPDNATHAIRIRDGAGYLRLGTLDLDPMDQADSEALFDALVHGSQSRPSPTERRAILQAAGGYPLALELFLRDWEEHGQRSIALSVGAMTADVHANPEQSYQRLAEGILRDLDPTSRMVLQVATLLDRRMNEFDMYRVVDVSAAQTMASLSHLVGRRALRDAGSGLEFVNPAIRAHGYLNIPASLRRALHGLVADKLLERSRAGEGIPGLEIAWHCIRADRASEAGPYLLAGAREAMHAGAPHEAELALRSGMDLLDDNQRPQGRLLLAETLQELGRWADSLEVLGPGKMSGGTEYSTRAEILEVTARHRLGQFATSEQVELLAVLEETIRSQVFDAETRVQACRAAVSIASKLSDYTVFTRLLAALNSIPKSTIGSLARAKCFVAEATLHYHLRDIASSKACLLSAEALLGPEMFSSPLLAALRIGLGAIACADGRYDEGKPHLAKAYAAGCKMDNTDVVVQASANLSLCSVRLGDYAAGIRWGQLCTGHIGSSYYPEYLVQAAYCTALSYALLGRRQEALDTMGLTTPIVDSFGISWLGQKWALFNADICYVVGRCSEALGWAEAGLTGGWTALQAERHAGPYARWVAKLAIERSDPQYAAIALEQVFRKGDELDVLDQLELAAVKAALLREGADVPTLGAQQETGVEVSDVIAEQLSRFGFDRLQPCSTRRGQTRDAFP